MMAMTIFMGSIPALARSCGLQGWAVYLGNGARSHPGGQCREMRIKRRASLPKHV
jgi:hypothetical protein